MLNICHSNRISPFNNNLLIIIVSHRTLNAMRDLFFTLQVYLYISYLYCRSHLLYVIFIVVWIINNITENNITK